MKLTKLEELYAYAEERGYPVIEPPKDGTIDSMAMLSPRGTPCIFFRPDGYTAQEQNERMVHEIGHCEELAFYTILSAPTCREKCEEKARRWSYRKMVPLSAILDGLSRGLRDVYDFSEELEVPPQMVADAIEYYKVVLGPLAVAKKIRNSCKIPTA